MSYPILKPNSAWFCPVDTSLTRATITAINIVDTYTITGAENHSWDASNTNDGSIICYITGTELTIAGNGSGKISVNTDASFIFSDINKSDFFNTCTTINGLNILDTSEAITMEGMFHGCAALIDVNVSTFDTSNVTNMSYMFSAVNTGTPMALTSINFGTNFVKSTVTNISFMLFSCSNLTTLDIDDWDISNVTDIRSFAKGGDKLTTFGANNLANWDFGNVIYMDEAFRNLLVMPNLAIENWNVSKVQTMYALFCANAKMFSDLDLRNWNMSNCKELSFVFWGCTSLKTLNCANWDVSNVETFDHFIARTNGITNFDHSGWNVSSKCKNLNALFHTYKGTEIDVRGWDTSNVEVFTQMFESCRNLKVIHGLNELDTSGGKDFTQMFWSTTSLEEMDLSKFDTTHAIDDYPLSRNGSIGDGLSGIFAGGKHANLKKIVLTDKFSFYGDGSLSEPCSAVLPTPQSGYWYDLNKTQYTVADIKALGRHNGTYYSTLELVEEALKAKKYMSYNSLQKYDTTLKNYITETQKDIISVDGGGSLTLEDIFGEPPYTIEVTDELEELQNVVVAAGSDYGTYRLRNVAIVTEIPTQMNDGDIALVIKQEG